jgi:hypothetical protein
LPPRDLGGPKKGESFRSRNRNRFRRSWRISKAYVLRERPQKLRANAPLEEFRVVGEV